MSFLQEPLLTGCTVKRSNLLYNTTMISKAKQMSCSLNTFRAVSEQWPHACRLRYFLVNKATNKQSIQFPQTNAETGTCTKIVFVLDFSSKVCVFSSLHARFCSCSEFTVSSYENLIEEPKKYHLFGLQ